MTPNLRFLPVFLLFSLLGHAGTKDPSEYPLRVQILQTTWNTGGFRTTGHGRGNVMDGGTVRGFEYNFECGHPFNATQGDATYMGRWSKPEARLVIVTVEIGNSNKQHECELKTTVLDVVYAISNGGLVSYSREQYEKMQSARKVLSEEAHPSDTDPAHYPLHVIIMEAQWEKNAGGGMLGGGRGDVRLGDAQWAIEFRALCPSGLRVSPEGTFYPGRWAQEGSRLLVLSHAIGDSQSSHVCEFKTEAKPGWAYMRNTKTGALALFTPEQYKTWLERKKAGGSGTAAKAEPAFQQALRIEELEDLLRNSVSTQRIRDLVQKYGVAFQLTDEAEGRLRSVGADDALLLTIAKAKK